ncbi:MAG: Hsp33 family molecular chaperone HslO, partial [Sphingopyxis sp.]
EALVLTALLGSTMKDEGSQMTMQAQSDNGPISLLVCDYLSGQLRGYVQYDADRLAEAGTDPTLFALFGKGFLGITFDQSATKDRYQGIVPLEGTSLAHAVENYFQQSEQVPTVIRLAMRKSADGDGAGTPHCIAGGVMVQQLPVGEDGGERLDVRADRLSAHDAWDHVGTIAETVKAQELTDPALSMEALVWRLYHDEEEVRVVQGDRLVRGCRCDPAYLASVIARFPADERADMVSENGNIMVDCAFCSKQFAIDPAAIPTAH